MHEIRLIFTHAHKVKVISNTGANTKIHYDVGLNPTVETKHTEEWRRVLNPTKKKPFTHLVEHKEGRNINHDHGMNNHHDPSVLRHVSTGSTGSFRSSTGSVSSPSTPTNTPLVIPQPVKPPNKTNKTYHCKMCDQIFTTKSDMLIHSQQIHKQDPKPYRCPTCQRCFANASYLSQHNRIHAGIRPYKCEICERKFTQLSHLQQHIRTHTGEKPYKCGHPGCGKAFSQLSNLQSHSRSHMTDKPFRCNSCYKCFSDEQSLREHIPKHSETKHLKTHICRICGKSYTQETYLTRHMTKHSQDNMNLNKMVPTRPIKSEPHDHSNGAADFSRLQERPTDSAPLSCGKVSSAFIPIPQFGGNVTSTSNSPFPFGTSIPNNSPLSPSLPHISSMATRGYFGYDPINFRKPDGPERSLNASMARDSQQFLANSLLSLQQIKNYATQMPNFSSCTGGSSVCVSSNATHPQTTNTQPDTIKLTKTDKPIGTRITSKPE
ncbi:hypothetical protein FSP39_011710 [Pinctada imbricata]|uniref:C2H2-type domain-containing protein n=1 Tax=Pinctada imbricata TaxID=66713 RepID=A0AA88YNJ3_PINIB|nr:hypothetical protein FSP39_011710 [Pinctada imbricata]